jgi:DNA replication protein DnaC
MEYGYPLRHIRKLENGPLPWPDDDKADKAYQALLQDGSCVVLVGPRGTGKTQLAVELGASMSRDLQLTQRYTTLSGLLQEEKDSWNKPPALDSFNRPTSPLKKAQSVGLLVLDEIQEVASTDWAMAQLIHLFDARYGDMKRTILISNLMPEAMEKFVGPSIWSRVTETGLLVLCGGDGWGSFR